MGRGMDLRAGGRDAIDSGRGAAEELNRGGPNGLIAADAIKMKPTVAFALHDLLAQRDVQHAVIEGDCLDFARPAPWKHRLAVRSLAAMWKNYRHWDTDGRTHGLR